jgi:hypothetical protein
MRKLSKQANGNGQCAPETCLRPKYSTRETAKLLGVNVVLARGKVRENHSRIIVVGIVLGIVAVGGILVLFLKPENAKDVWIIIGPILSVGISVLLGKQTTSEK